MQQREPIRALVASGDAPVKMVYLHFGAKIRIQQSHEGWEIEDGHPARVSFFNRGMGVRKEPLQAAPEAIVTQPVRQPSCRGLPEWGEGRRKSFRQQRREKALVSGKDLISTISI